MDARLGHCQRPLCQRGVFRFHRDGTACPLGGWDQFSVVGNSPSLNFRGTVIAHLSLAPRYMHLSLQRSRVLFGFSINRRRVFGRGDNGEASAVAEANASSWSGLGGAGGGGLTLSRHGSKLVMVRDFWRKRFVLNQLAVLGSSSAFPTVLRIRPAFWRHFGHAHGSVSGRSCPIDLEALLFQCSPRKPAELPG
jgi:hypothetical protein